METTKIDPNRTIDQISAVLRRYGVSSILTDYSAGSVSALSFTYPVQGRPVPFTLPCRWLQIYNQFRKRRALAPVEMAAIPEGSQLAEQARRVAWRQLLRWVEAQLALTETGMARVEEVFLPYIQQQDGRTLFERLDAGDYKLLEGPKA